MTQAASTPDFEETDKYTKGKKTLNSVGHGRLRHPPLSMVPKSQDLRELQQLMEGCSFGAVREVVELQHDWIESRFFTSVSPLSHAHARWLKLYRSFNFLLLP